MQELTFTYEPEDYSFYAKEIIRIDRISIYILKILAIPFCISVYVSIMYSGIYLYLSFLLMCILAFIVSKLFTKHIIKLQKDIAYDNTTLMFDYKKIIVLSKQNKSIQTTFYWNSIKDIYNTKHLLIIFLSDLQGLVIPKRIFNSEEEIDNCWKSIQDFCSNAQKKA